MELFAYLIYIFIPQAPAILINPSPRRVSSANGAVEVPGNLGGDFSGVVAESGESKVVLKIK